MKNKKKSICITSAFYNEEENLENFIKNFNKTRSKLLKMGYSINLVLVNDGSTDRSVKIVKKAILLKKFIKLISLKKNYGQQIAIYVGLKEIKADFYGVLDSDCQQNSNLFIQMINQLKSKKLELLQMKKKYGNYESLIKKSLSEFFYYIFSKITNVDIKPGSSDFYLFTHKVRNKVISSNISKFFLRGFIHLNSLKKEYLEYLPAKRLKGTSKYDIFNQLNFAFTAIYLYGNKIFMSIFISFLVVNAFLMMFIIFKNSSFDLITQGSTIFVTLFISFVVINLIFYCLIIFFLIKIETNKFVNPKYKIEK